jgi:hypothetical protein
MSGQKLSVMWGGGDVQVDLTPSAKAWTKIEAGQPVTIKGGGYLYEGERFKDTWHFNCDGAGTLRVSYGDGDGFVGDIKDALI